MDSEKCPMQDVHSDDEEKEGFLMDYHLFSIVLGTYFCQAVILNSLFIMITNISQWVQDYLRIDTSSFFSGRISGIITVTFGSYISYKLSEIFIYGILTLFKGKETMDRVKQVIRPLKSSLSSINAPLLALHRGSQFLHNQVPMNLGSLNLHIKNEILKFGGFKEVNKEKVKISVKRDKVLPKKFKRELFVISTYSLVTFLFLGGNFHAFTPSELSHPGAYSVPNLSLEAKGYTYASKDQRNIIQMLGKKYGCHSCGMISDSEKYIADHQPPSGVIKRRLKGKYISFLLRNKLIPIQLVKRKQYFYPHCSRCSQRQAAAAKFDRFHDVKTKISMFQEGECYTLRKVPDISSLPNYIFCIKV